MMPAERTHCIHCMEELWSWREGSSGLCSACRGDGLDELQDDAGGDGFYDEDRSDMKTDEHEEEAW